MMFVLKLPQSPLSAVTTITSVRLAGVGSRSASSGCADGSTRVARLARTRCICCAYGRALIIRSCARRSFDAATIFIALVICCVFLTARIRRRRSMREGISGGGRLSRREVADELLHRGVQRRLELIVELLLLGDAAEQLRVARLDELVEPGLERAHVVDRDAVEIAVRAGVDDRDLALDR